MTNRPESKGVFYPEDIDASLTEVYEAEAGLDSEPDSVAERIAHRPRVLRYYESALEERDANMPVPVSSWFSGVEIVHTASQDPEAYRVNKRRVEMIDAFSELAEERLDGHILQPEHAIAETLEELVGEQARKAVSLSELRVRLVTLCSISELYRKDCT